MTVKFVEENFQMISILPKFTRTEVTLYVVFVSFKAENENAMFLDQTLEKIALMTLGARY